jgi:hypothetical protein
MRLAQSSTLISGMGAPPTDFLHADDMTGVCPSKAPLAILGFELIALSLPGRLLYHLSHLRNLFAADAE